MLKIKEIADHLGLSKSQTRRRVKAIKNLVNEDSISRGDYNEIMVKQDAFEVLKKLEEYRKSGNTTREAKERIKEELDNEVNSKNSEPRQTDPIKHHESNQLETHQPRQTDLGIVKEQFEKRLAEKDERIRELQRDKQRLQDKNDTLEQRLLTGATINEGKENPYKDKSLWQVIREWLKSPAG